MGHSEILEKYRKERFILLADILTILTPTYNRAMVLNDLFDSLNCQTDKQFIWLIIDDGSNDNTESLVKTFIEKADFEIKYYKKNNGGKHTALNVGFQMVTSFLTFIVDSDDVLTSDAVKEIKQYSDTVKKKDLAGVAFLRGYDELTCIGNKFPKDNDIMNDIDVRFRHKVTGDKAEVWRTDILKQYQFPVFENERFQGENYIWWQIALKYNMLYINKIIYITKYLEGGLTKSGKLLRIHCCKGGMANSRIGFDSRFPITVRMKYATLYNCYAFFAKVSLKKRLSHNKNKRLLVMAAYLPGYLVYVFWKFKYKV